MVTIRGSNLDIGSGRSVHLVNVFCDIMRYLPYCTNNNLSQWCNAKFSNKTNTNKHLVHTSDHTYIHALWTMITIIWCGVCCPYRVEEEAITCLTSNSSTNEKGGVKVAIDNWEETLPEAYYEYASNPTFISISPQFSFAGYVSLVPSTVSVYTCTWCLLPYSGGTTYMIKGKNLDTVQEPRLLLHLPTSQSRRRRQTDGPIQSEVWLITISSGHQISSPSPSLQPCTVEMSDRMTCSAPAINISAMASQQPATIGLLMDGVTELIRIDGQRIVIHSNPRFKTFDQSFRSNDEIRLTVQSEVCKMMTS